MSLGVTYPCEPWRHLPELTRLDSIAGERRSGSENRGSLRWGLVHEEGSSPMNIAVTICFRD